MGKNSVLLTNISVAQFTGSELDTLQTADIQVDDPAAADAMMVHLTFNGLGEREMTEKEKQTLLSFAANLYATIDR